MREGGSSKFGGGAGVGGGVESTEVHRRNVGGLKMVYLKPVKNS